MIDNNPLNICSICSESLFTTEDDDDEAEGSPLILRTMCDHHYHKGCFEHHISGDLCLEGDPNNQFFFCIKCNQFNYIKKLTLLEREVFYFI